MILLFKRALSLFTVLLLFFTIKGDTQELPLQADVQWAVIGAGGAGIIVVGLLLDLGISPQQIAWIDPEFNVGRLGKYYTNVPANVKAKTFVNFLSSCKTFRECQSDAIADSIITIRIRIPLRNYCKPVNRYNPYALPQKCRVLQVYLRVLILKIMYGMLATKMAH